MFSECSSLKELNLNSFKVNKLTDASHMFEGCTSLIELNWNDLNGNHSFNMRDMFSKCSDDFKRKIKNKYKKLKGEAFQQYYLKK